MGKGVRNATQSFNDKRRRRNNLVRGLSLLLGPLILLGFSERMFGPSRVCFSRSSVEVETNGMVLSEFSTHL